jgi:hypothetical protein
LPNSDKTIAPDRSEPDWTIWSLSMQASQTALG